MSRLRWFLIQVIKLKLGCSMWDFNSNCVRSSRWQAAQPRHVNVSVVNAKKEKGITLKILGLHALNLCPKFAICQHCP